MFECFYLFDKKGREFVINGLIMFLFLSFYEIEVVGGKNFIVRVFK